MNWRRVIKFPSTYGEHALDAEGHCQTRDAGDYVGHHRTPELELDDEPDDGPVPLTW